MTAAPASLADLPRTVFIGGGNMSTALLGGLVAAGADAARLWVVEPFAAARERLVAAVPGLHIVSAAGPELGAAQAVVWAVKPQQFTEAAAAVAAGWPEVRQALQVSIMAGVRCSALARHTGAARLVRTMPNTPALIGRGITGAYANATCSEADRALADALLAPAGARVWVAREDLLDTVTAVSGSGPAYAFYLAEAMADAGTELGLDAAQARQLALATLAGAAELALRSDQPLATLRANVTSKGGTTAAALDTLEAARVGEHLRAAVRAAQRRSRELGDALDAG